MNTFSYIKDEENNKNRHWISGYPDILVFSLEIIWISAIVNIRINRKANLASQELGWKLKD
ncbi:CLUMA_CG006799, isoform A [Clunio marinus]|uniref:CLUMA_CG006799, isoform A n=1 Tax=Clunio marinus TaxID=568069 RepID=A0A1J1HYS8_9DIPT|nr:CLUMA_CG006799, isoform A [Clunio marinus]